MLNDRHSIALRAEFHWGTLATYLEELRLDPGKRGHIAVVYDMDPYRSASFEKCLERIRNLGNVYVFVTGLYTFTAKRYLFPRIVLASFTTMVDHRRDDLDFVPEMKAYCDPNFSLPTLTEAQTRCSCMWNAYLVCSSIEPKIAWLDCNKTRPEVSRCRTARLPIQPLEARKKEYAEELAKSKLPLVGGALTI